MNHDLFRLLNSNRMMMRWRGLLLDVRGLVALLAVPLIVVVTALWLLLH